jgi:hypothetical protein
VRFIALLNSIRVPISNEESEFIEFVKENEPVVPSKMDERQRELALGLIKRDLLEQIDDGEDREDIRFLDDYTSMLDPRYPVVTKKKIEYFGDNK